MDDRGPGCVLAVMIAAVSLGLVAFAWWILYTAANQTGL